MHAQEVGIFRPEVDALFAAQAFYGAVEQLLTEWIFDDVAPADDRFDEARNLLVMTICDGLEPR